MDVEGRASLKRRAGRAGILVHRGAVACGGGRRYGRGQVGSRALWSISRHLHIGFPGIEEDASRWVRREVERVGVALCLEGSPRWRSALLD